MLKKNRYPKLSSFQKWSHSLRKAMKHKYIHVRGHKSTKNNSTQFLSEAGSPSYISEPKNL